MNEIIKWDPGVMMPKTQEESLRILGTYPMQYYKALTPITIKDVFNSPCPSMALARKVIGPMGVRAIMAGIITDTAMFFNTGQNMNQDQVVELADIILEEYYYLKLDDFKLCFKNAKKGRYGKIFRIDGAVMLEWLEAYLKDRLNDADEVSYTEHQSNKGENRVTGFEKTYNKFKKS